MTTETTEPTAKVSATKSINVAVAEKLSAAGSIVLNSVIDRIAEVEIKRRADALLKAVEAAERLQRDLNKVNRPDQVVYSTDRKPVSEGYSKARLDEIEKLTQKLAKIDKAVAKATADKPDYTDLLNLKTDDNSAAKAGGESEG